MFNVYYINTQVYLTKKLVQIQVKTENKSQIFSAFFIKHVNLVVALHNNIKNFRCKLTKTENFLKLNSVCK